jgi:hypothetical protein
MIETPRYENMSIRMQSMIERIDKGMRRTGDRVSPDDEAILKYVGHASSVIISDAMMLRKQLLDRMALDRLTLRTNNA